MTEYLTTFANILDELFKNLSECGLMTSYTVQLQSSLAGLEIMLKFKAVIHELIKDLQKLLSAIPSIASVEASTQTQPAEDTPHKPVGCENKDGVQELDPENTTEKLNSPSSPTIELCELKPLIIEASDEFTELVSRKDENMKVENIVHIVVETAAPSDLREHTFHPATDSNIIKLEQLRCSECEMDFSSRDELKTHLRNRQNPHHHLQFCDMCDKMFTCVQSLQEHCRRDHGGAGCFVCTACGKRFMTKLSYTRHLHTHNGRKEAVCDLCGKAFSRADYLQTHYSIHLGKRNYACSQCPRKFVRSIHLKAHEKIHSGVKEHVCKVCGKAFGRSDKLKEHTLRHLNIKRFQCPVCQRDYAEKRDLKIHLKLHSK